MKIGLNYKKVKMRTALRCALFFYSLLFTSVALAENLTFAVLYPESSSAVSKLYKTIIKGMQKNARVDIVSRYFNNDNSLDDLKRWVQQQDSDALIVLGSKGRKLGQLLQLDIPIVSGAHALTAPNQASVSLAVDPEQLFSLLKKLNPHVRRVFVTYNKKNTGWLIQRALRSAKNHNIELVHISVTSAKQSGAAFNRIKLQAQVGEDAIWLPADPTVPINIILPDLLKVAWDKNLILFGGNPRFVKRGALFALYPDFSRMGKQLVNLAYGLVQKTKLAQPEPNIHLKKSLNTRMANHLGIDLLEVNAKDFDLLYPRRQR